MRLDGLCAGLPGMKVVAGPQLVEARSFGCHAKFDQTRSGELFVGENKADTRVRRHAFGISIPEIRLPRRGKIYASEGMAEPEAGDTRSRTPLWKNLWLVGAVVLLVAAVIGIAVGASLGSRQGGPLSAEGAAGGRPTIVVGTVSPAASPAAVAAASPSTAPSPAVGTAVVPAGSTEYVVQPGDTLRSIAQDQYGDATLWPRIYDANRDVIGPNPDALVAGTKLQIPPQ